MRKRGFSGERRFFPAAKPAPLKQKSGGNRKRVPVVNGIFYPENPELLIDQLASWGLKEGVCSAFGGQTIIAPHGAWNRSGSAAGAAFASIQKNELAPNKGINRVILLGPCHNSGEEGIYLSDSFSFDTPLGNLAVDLKLNRELASCSSLIKVNDVPHLLEHCLEVLLPLVKFCLGEVKIIPILVNGSRPVLISELTGAFQGILKNYLDESLLVISSNASRNMDPVLALSMAGEFSSLLSDMDTEAFSAGLGQGRINACGAAIIAALLESGLLHGQQFSSLTPLSHSTEDDGETVYYGAFTTG